MIPTIQWLTNRRHSFIRRRIPRRAIRRTHSMIDSKIRPTAATGAASMSSGTPLGSGLESSAGFTLCRDTRRPRTTSRIPLASATSAHSSSPSVLWKAYNASGVAVVTWNTS